VPLQNRVTPFGDIVAIDGRGLFTGNRGILVDGARHIVRYSQLRRWIVCRLEYRGIRRTIMRPNSWTELFFLDEATALSAGHRPCAECRNADYKLFRDLWARCHGTPVSADIMDRQLHGERIEGRRGKRVYRADIGRLPDGAYVSIDGRAWLLLDTSLFAWSGDGYTERRKRPRKGRVDVLTPRSMVAVLAAGYRPVIHPSAHRRI
jgi:hypothetical protein